MTKPQQATQPVDDTGNAQVILLEADGELAALDDLLPHVARLIEPVRGQRSTLRPKPTLAELAHERIRIRQEKADAVETQRRGMVILGASPAPLSVAALDTSVHVSNCLAAVTVVLQRHLGVCFLPNRGHSDRTRLRRIRRELAGVDDVRVARWIVEQASSARRAAERLVDGEPSRRLNARCPYCHEESLVVYQGDRGHDSEFIRCDHGPNVACICSTEDCACKKNPEGYRHTWRRARGGWDILAGLINRHNATCEHPECPLAKTKLRLHYPPSADHPDGLVVTEPLVRTARENGTTLAGARRLVDSWVAAGDLIPRTDGGYDVKRFRPRERQP